MHITAARFSLSVDGYDLGSWAKCDGLAVSWDVAEYDGGLPLVVKPRPTGMSHTLTLIRPRGTDVKVQTWYRSAQSGPASRKSCAIIVYDTQGAPVARYHLTNAWPSKLEIGSLRAGDSTQLMETITIVSERIQRVSG